MLEPAVICSGIYKACEAELLDVPQPLKPLMFNKIKDEIARDAYESIDRIVDDLPLIRTVSHPLKY
jgi:hypothetical protein